MIHYTTCPACGGQHIHSQLTAKDYTVSQQDFAIWHCDDCSLRFTQDVPAQDAIGAYYQSDAYISHSDTKEGLVNRLYHMVRNHTLKGKRKLVQSQTGLQKGSILDIGCGTGAFLHTMKEGGWTITGLEPDATARTKAKELYGIEPGEPGSLFTLPAGGYQGITMWHVLEHVHELHAYLRRLHDLLAPGGKIFIAVPNYTSSDAELYQQYWAAYDVPRHLYHFSPASMEKLLSLFQLQLVAIKPMWFDSFYVSMLSEQYKNGKENMLRAFWNGLRSNMKASSDKGKCSSVIYIIQKI